jgi:hypothetical protein
MESASAQAKDVIKEADTVQVSRRSSTSTEIRRSGHTDVLKQLKKEGFKNRDNVKAELAGFQAVASQLKDGGRVHHAPRRSSLSRTLAPDVDFFDALSLP